MLKRRIEKESKVKTRPGRQQVHNDLGDPTIGAVLNAESSARYRGLQGLCTVNRVGVGPRTGVHWISTSQ